MASTTSNGKTSTSTKQAKPVLKNGQGNAKALPVRRVKNPVTFVLDPASPNSVLVNNLEEKADVRSKNSRGQWVTTPYTPEQRTSFDRDSILYYFQCILQCGINMKFSTTRIPASEGGSTTRALKIDFSNPEDAQMVLESYQKKLNTCKTKS